MRRVWIVTCLVVWSLLQGLPCSGQMLDDVKHHPECDYCGMDRKQFAHSRMVVHHKQGQSVGVCSIFCAAKDCIKSLDEEPKSIKVADYNTKKLVDAAKAYWVMGGNKSGVMTNRAKWAFERKMDALAFIKKHGGELIDLHTAMKASYEDMYEDMRVLKEMKAEHSRLRASRSRDFVRN